MATKISTKTDNNTTVELEKEDGSYNFASPYFASQNISPENFETISLLFNQKPVKTSEAKVLEIGYGQALAAVAFATRHPNAKVHIIDISGSDYGLHYKQILGLKNLESESQKIQELKANKELEFDYIICHDIFSFLSIEDQKHLLEFLFASLSQNGIVHINYNTLPGNGVTHTIRDMLKYHTSHIDSNKTKLEQTVAFMNFIKDSVSSSNDSYANFLQKEIDHILAAPVGYVQKQYLGAENHSFYFSDLVAAAASVGFAYLGDANLPSMNLNNLPEKAIESLKPMSSNNILSEQYMDFFNNRRIRNSLFCKIGNAVKRTIDLGVLSKLYFASYILPEKSDIGLNIENSLENLSFGVSNSGTKFNTSVPVLKALFYSLYDMRGGAISFTELLNHMTTKIPSLKTEEIGDAIGAQLVKLILKGIVTVTTNKIEVPSANLATPKSSELARLQIASNSSSIVNQLGDTMNLNVIQRLVVFYSDGKNSIDDIVTKILDHVNKNEIILNLGSNKITDQEQRKKLLPNLITNTIENMRKWYCLV